MVDNNIAKKVYKQDYSQKHKIEGVQIIDMPYFSDDGGSFTELFRAEGTGSLKQHFPDFELKQINWSILEPGLIKGGHLHKNQEDIWFVPPTDKLIVGLIDAREESKSKGTKMRFIMGGGKARLLYIPRGVIHGVSNPYNRKMTVIYMVNQLWSPDPKNSDEFRVDYSEFGIGFWEIQKG